MISGELLSNSDAVDQITDDAAQLESVSDSPEWANQRPGERKIECHTISGDAASSAGYSNSQSDGSQASMRSTSFMAYQSSGLMARQSLVGVTPDDARLHSLERLLMSQTTLLQLHCERKATEGSSSNSGLAGSIGGKSLN
ncbi:hypothetical protein Droror1_Dr00007435 [Drosera rotundifolia]